MKTTRETFVSIDLDALSYNYNFFKNYTQKEVFGVVKANAYGHGDVEVAKHLENEDVKVLCVSSLDEALRLEKEGITTDILIFSYVNPLDVKKYNCNQFIFTIPSLSWFKEIISHNLIIRAHLEVDTGMNRMGVKSLEEIQEIIGIAPFKIEGMYTHFSSSENNMEVTQRQANLFREIHDTLNYDFKWLHAGNTHGALNIDDSILNAVRIGIGLYGYSESNHPLKPVMSWYTHIIHIESLDIGESVGYNQTFIAQKSMKFATIPVGYADGFDVRNRGLDVYIEGNPSSILGKICMDQTMIEVDSNNKVGDLVELMGPNRTVKDIANHLGVIPYVVFTGVSYRVRREYKKSL